MLIFTVAGPGDPAHVGYGDKRPGNGPRGVAFAAAAQGRRQCYYTAARIVGEADPGTVVVSGTAWLHLRDHCRGRSKGFVPLKGKGSLELVVCEELR